MTKYDKNHYFTCMNITINHCFKCKYLGNHHVKHSLWSNLTKIITVKANGKETVTLTGFPQLLENLEKW